MNTRIVPFRFAFPFMGGIALGGVCLLALPALGLWLIGGMVLAIFLGLLQYQYQHRWAFGLYLHLLFFGAGLYRVQHYDERSQAAHFAQLPDSLHEVRYFVGTVYDAPGYGTKIKLPLRVEWVGTGPDALRPATGNVLLFATLDDSIAATARYGDRLGVRATLRPTEPPRNPDAFDYQRYLHFQNIHYQAFVRPDSVLWLSGGHGHALWRSAYGCRDRLLRLLRQHFPTQDEYAVACALLVGYKDELSEDLRTAYAETGSMHALAVSGTHVGMLYLGLMWLLRHARLRGRWKRLETLLLLIAIWAFTFITGATASVLRASVMFTLYLLAKILHRDAPVWNVLAASAFGLLLYNPYFLFDAGFQLSYAAVAGMVFFYPRFYKMFPPWPRWADEVLKILLVGMAAQLGTLPLSLYYFNQFPVYFWLAGWIVVFGGAIFLWGGALLVVLDGWAGPLADGLGSLLYYMVWGMNRLILAIQTLPGSVVANVWIALWVIVGLYVAIIFLGSLLEYRRTQWWRAFWGVIIALGAYRNWSVLQKQGQQRMVVYAVNKQRLVDFFDGDQVYTLRDSMPSRQERFAAQSHRVVQGMRQQCSLPFAADTAFQAANLHVRFPLVSFFGKNVLFLDNSDWLTALDTLPPLPVEMVVLSKNPHFSVAECRARFPFGKIVFDATNSPAQVARWRAECATHAWAFHDVRSQGAWEWHLR